MAGEETFISRGSEDPFFPRGGGSRAETCPSIQRELAAVLSADLRFLFSSPPGGQAEAQSRVA